MVDQILESSPIEESDKFFLGFAAYMLVVCSTEPPLAYTYNPFDAEMGQARLPQVAAKDSFHEEAVGRFGRIVPKSQY